jgi:hypothetical protein
VAASWPKDALRRHELLESMESIELLEPMQPLRSLEPAGSLESMKSTESMELLESVKRKSLSHRPAAQVRAEKDPVADLSKALRTASAE